MKMCSLGLGRSGERGAGTSGLHLPHPPEPWGRGSALLEGPASGQGRAARRGLQTPKS